MAEERKQRLLGLVCTLIGAAFVIAGIVIFIMSNYMNFQMKKTDATVMALYQIDTVEGERHTMVELSFRVGTELVFASYEYPGVLDENTVALDVYYNVKDPTMVFDIGWYWQPLLVLLLGLPILVTGLYYLGVIKFEAFKLIPPDKKATNTQKEVYKAKKSVFENILPMFAGILFVTFGIIMLIMNRGWWAWMFIVIGIVELLYIGMEFVPALIIWIGYARVNKLKNKVKVYDVEVEQDKEDENGHKEVDAKGKSKKAEKKASEPKKTENAALEEEDLEPFEIKEIKTTPTKAKKKSRTNKKKK